MTFKIEIKLNPLTIQFEAGSIPEGVAILQEQASAISGMFVQASQLVNGNTAVEAGNTVTADAESTGKGKRGSGGGRGPSKKNQPDPSTASAPPPAPLPDAAPGIQPPAFITEPGPNGIPAFLDRTKEAPTATVAAPPAPPPAAPAATAVLAAPPAPPAPPPPPPAPPAVTEFTLAPKVIDNLKTRAAQASDSGASLVTWLSQSGLIATPCTFDEALSVLKFVKDAQIKQVADALGVA